MLCTAKKGGCTVSEMLENTEQFGKPTIQLLLREQDTEIEASSQECSLIFCRSDWNVSPNFTSPPLTAVRL